MTRVASLPVPFCGRNAQMAVLSEQLDRARSGAGTVVLVEGDAGMGKSRLLDEAALVARRRSFRVGGCVADPGDSMVELATLMGALFDGPDPVLDRAEVPDSPALPERRYWLLHDLQGLLDRAALETPLLICLDDLQWADGGTAAALRALPNRLATVPVAWILAFRPSPGSRQLQSALDGTVALGDPSAAWQSWLGYSSQIDRANSSKILRSLWRAGTSVAMS